MKSFTELNLSEAIMKAISELGYLTPSPIQAQALPILTAEPTDFIGLAATGTGKTAAFGIPLIEKIDYSNRSVQGLVLCPTRELALQVTGQLNLLGKHKGVRALPIYGGASYSDQIHGLKRGVNIVVGTPGRIIDHMTRGTLKLQDVKTVILDEADEMISMGFKDDLEQILVATPKEQSNIWLFSATMGKEVRRVADTYLRDPQQVQVNRKEMLSSTIEQLYYPTRESDKPEILCKLIESADDFYGIIFCQTKSLVSDLTQYLVNKGYKVDCLHGDKDQNSRERTMQAFRDRKVTVLVCTDVASRGLDVKDITHVINYSIPRELDNYVHRIGRTARSGKSGVAMSLVTAANRGLIGRIEAMTKSKMKEGKIPTRKDIGMKKASKVLSQFQEQKFFQRGMEVLGEDWKSAISTMTNEEVVGRFLTLLAPDIFIERDKPKTYPAPTFSGGSRGEQERQPERRRFRRDDERPDRDDRRARPSGDRRTFRGNDQPKRTESGSWGRKPPTRSHRSNV
jgi:ATP-dependent RNA helicase DeaD